MSLNGSISCRNLKANTSPGKGFAFFSEMLTGTTDWTYFPGVKRTGQQFYICLGAFKPVKSPPLCSSSSHTLIFSFPESQLNSSFYDFCWVAAVRFLWKRLTFPTHTEGQTTHTYVCCGSYTLREDSSYLHVDVLICSAHPVFLYSQLREREVSAPKQDD